MSVGWRAGLWEPGGRRAPWSKEMTHASLLLAVGPFQRSPSPLHLFLNNEMTVLTAMSRWLSGLCAWCLAAPMAGTWDSELGPGSLASVPVLGGLEA